jgi:catechol 2,3-dioxygenase-like lactoylglutathione lyase family enzyme
VTTTSVPSDSSALSPISSDDPAKAGPDSEAAVLSRARESNAAPEQRNLANPTTRAGLSVVRPEIKVRQLFHHAYRAQDTGATRHFYEDVLGMPLLATFVETWDPVNDRPTNYIHTYFGLGDGSALAFFQFAEGNESPTGYQPVNPFDQHIALYVDSLESLRDVQRRLDAEGVPIMEIDHGYCYSIYVHDPNGLQVELAVDVPSTEQIMAEAAPVARRTLDAWLVGVREGNNRWRGTGLTQ